MVTSSEDSGSARPPVPTPSSLTHAQYCAIQEHLSGTTAFGGLRLHDGGLIANYATTPTDPASREAIDQAREIYPLAVTCLQYTETQLQRAIRRLTEPSRRTKTSILLYMLAPLPSGAGLEIRAADGTAAACSPDGPSLLAQLGPSVPVIITEGPAPAAGPLLRYQRAALAQPADPLLPQTREGPSRHRPNQIPPTLERPTTRALRGEMGRPHFGDVTLVGTRAHAG